MSESKLTNAQKARIERNRQKALLLRNSRLTNRPYPPRNKEKDRETHNDINSSSGTTSSRIVDTGGGFLLDAEDEEEWSRPPRNLVEEPAPILGGERLICDECGKEFMDSYLYRIFDAEICDSCRQSDESGKFSLITKTEAKQQFLLKDVDLDRREPPLKFQVKKNPHYSRGEMKLYLLSQVKERAYEVWGDEDKLEQAKEDKLEKREIQKQKKFDKKVKELRKAVRTSTWRKDLSKHEHVFPKEGEEGGETYDEETDTWTKTCKDCGYQLNFEKM
ncbi:DNA repair protein complementing XP-A cells homolog [Exaiptasia diaphana]|uniref:XPA C-terminal domain-containing protein n=1 Tax=Exaiptasia diaphana TaxID=2652724 RepID=A0A913Y7Y3_EXADI|nr:DNA repair protein complementing XP-A cells homolog [Exaiptasia diaphana]KXJ28889.1 DNA repair protein complementing XP-A cells-like [Exaiptasia diaphana]